MFTRKNRNRPATLIIQPGGAFFSAEHDVSVRAAYECARRMSAGSPDVYEIVLSGTDGDGIVGMYEGGCVLPEFHGHDRNAGLSSRVKGA